MSYRRSFDAAHSLTYRMIDGADHSLSGEGCHEAYTAILTSWISDMIIGERIGN